MNSLFNDDTVVYYIPTGREHEKSYLGRIFKNKIDSIKHLFNTPIEEMDGAKFSYISENGKDLAILPDGKKISVDDLSSGQKQILWLYNLLYTIMQYNNKSFVIIEEPEANLYPTLQKELIIFISKFVNKTGSSVYITTHSPYTLTVCNLLYCEGKSANDKARNVCGKDTALDTETTSILKIDNSIITSLISKEYDEILTESIDEVSDEITKQYTDIFYLSEGDIND